MICCLLSIIIVAIVVILSWLYRHKEMLVGHGTRIMRTVGVVNDADEIPVAAGIITSMPLMDMTHTYWDGHRPQSCDQCPNKETCPKCPQWAETRQRRDPFTGRGDVIQPPDPEFIKPPQQISIESYIPGDHEYMASNVPHCANTRGKSGQVEMLTGASVYDPSVIDTDFVGSREALGAASAPCPRPGGRICGLFSASSDDIYDGDRLVQCVTGRAPPCDRRPALKLLYTDVRTLGNPPASPDDCEYRGPQGYTYKEPRFNQHLG